MPSAVLRSGSAERGGERSSDCDCECECDCCDCDCDCRVAWLARRADQLLSRCALERPLWLTVPKLRLVSATPLSLHESDEASIVSSTAPLARRRLHPLLRGLLPLIGGNALRAGCGWHARARARGGAVRCFSKSPRSAATAFKSALASALLSALRLPSLRRGAGLTTSGDGERFRDASDCAARLRFVDTATRVAASGFSDFHAIPAQSAIVRPACRALCLRFG